MTTHCFYSRFARYMIVIGSKESVRWCSGDGYALRLAARYARWMFPKYARHVREAHPGSMADAMCNAWHDPVTVTVYRTPTDSAGIVKCVPVVKVGSFELAAAPEWCRRG